MTATLQQIGFPPPPRLTWWQRLLRYEHISGDGICPTYLHRWTLFTAFGCGVYVHKFVGDDWSKAQHDHPKRFISIGLVGGYVEHTPDAPPRSYRAPWLRTFPATHVHRLTGPTPEHPCWTVVIVLWRQREWGFWWTAPDDRGIPTRRWFHWLEFLASNNARNSKSCP